MPDEMIAFGPVPSPRLGQSLGINNIPPKSCSEWLWAFFDFNADCVSRKVASTAPVRYR